MAGTTDPNVKELIGTKLGFEDKMKIYDQWSGTYDQTLEKLGYEAPRKCCEAVCKYYNGDKETAVIFDIGVGTGLLGEEIKKDGFKIIDGLDPSPEMLTKTEDKKIYRNLYCLAFNSDKTPNIAADTYDILTVVGSFNNGHIPFDAIIEMIRITKPGGLICISNRLSPFNESPEYVGKFFPLCDQLEKDGKWKKEEITEFKGFLNTADGIIIVYRVL